MTEDEARRRFVEETDALNVHAQRHGPAPDSASRMRAIIAAHEARCAALAEHERAAADDAMRLADQRLGS